jgi:hypothetical protein
MKKKNEVINFQIKKEKEYTTCETRGIKLIMKDYEEKFCNHKSKNLFEIDEMY